MREPQILAFMQNPWFPPETDRGIIDKYSTDRDFHRRLLSRTMSGRRLLDVFGPTMFNTIIWDNVAPTPATVPNGITDIDMEHVDKTIRWCKPDLILAFGKLAEIALDKSINAIHIDYICCPHPNTRGLTSEQLSNEVLRICDWINNWKANMINKEWLAFRKSINKEVQDKLPKDLDTPIGRYES